MRRSACRHIVPSLRDSDSESSDSDSEVTVVRGDAPPTQSIEVARHDVSALIEVQVSMDAWGVVVKSMTQRSHHFGLTQHLTTRVEDAVGRYG